MKNITDITESEQASCIILFFFIFFVLCFFFSFLDPSLILLLYIFVDFYLDSEQLYWISNLISPSFACTCRTCDTCVRHREENTRNSLKSGSKLGSL